MAEKKLTTGEKTELAAPFDQEEVTRAWNSGNMYSELNNDRLKESANVIFRSNQDGAVLTPQQYTKIVEGNYDPDFDLEEHGKINLIDDAVLLTRFLTEAISTTRFKTNQITNKIFVLGCGPGRNAVLTIELAKKLGLQEICFTDLVDHHIEKLRAKIKSTYGDDNVENVKGVKLSYKVGDFMKIAETIKEKFDAVLATWFVTPEIADFSSVDALFALRHKLFVTIRELLGKQGRLIEDVPYTEGGRTFYGISQIKTYKILSEMGILPGANDQMILSNFTAIQQTGVPHHIRFAPPNGKHKKELEKAGFNEQLSVVSTMPVGFAGQTALDEFNREMSPDNLISLVEMHNPNEVIRHFKSLKARVLIDGSESSVPLSKKTILWQKDPSFC